MHREGYLTTQEVAEQYGYNKMYLYRRRDMGKLVAYKFVGDRHTYWAHPQVEALAHQDSDEEPTARWRREVLG